MIDDIKLKPPYSDKTANFGFDFSYSEPTFFCSSLLFFALNLGGWIVGASLGGGIGDNLQVSIVQKYGVFCERNDVLLFTL